MKKKLFNKFRFHNFEMGKKKDSIRVDYQDYLEKEKNNYLSLIKLCKKFAIDNPKTQIIFRPHPRQDIELVKKRFGLKIRNIKIIYHGVITPWIAACELFIHSGCTSSLEAATLEKKIIYFVKENHTKKAKMFKNFGYFFNCENKCLNFLNRKLTNTRFNLNKAKLPTQIIQNSKKNFLFYKLYISYMKKKYENKLKPIKVSYNNDKYFFSQLISNLKMLIKYVLLKVPFFVEIMFFFNPSNLLTAEYKKKKFPHLNYKEIKDYIYRSLQTNKKIKIKKLSNDLFLIRNIKN